MALIELTETPQNSLYYSFWSETFLGDHMPPRGRETCYHFILHISSSATPRETDSCVNVFLSLIETAIDASACVIQVNSGYFLWVLLGNGIMGVLLLGHYFTDLILNLPMSWFVFFFVRTSKQVRHNLAQMYRVKVQSCKVKENVNQTQGSLIWLDRRNCEQTPHLGHELDLMIWWFELTTKSKWTFSWRAYTSRAICCKTETHDSDICESELK